MLHHDRLTARRDPLQRLGQYPWIRYTAAESMQHLEVMRHQGTLPDGIPYNALVSACGKGTQPKRALQPLETMRHQAFLLDGIPYNALVIVCGEGGVIAERLQPLEVRRHQGLLPDGITYSDLVSACGSVHSRREPCSSSR